MFVFQTLDLSRISEEKKALFKTLSSEDLFSREQDTKTLSIAAFFQDQPIALIDGYLYSLIREAFIVTFFVKPEWENQGIGTKLLTLFLKEAKEKDIHIVSLDYTKEQGKTSNIQHLLKNFPHSEKPVVKRFFFNPKTFTPDWYLSPDSTLPKDLEIIPWSKVKKEELEKIDAFKRQDVMLDLIDPRELQSSFDDETSFALLQKKRLVGWIVTTKKDPDSLTYASFFARVGTRAHGAPLVLLKKAIRSHFARNLNEIGILEFNQDRQSPSWQHFLEKRLAPFSTREEALMRAYFII